MKTTTKKRLIKMRWAQRIAAGIVSLILWCFALRINGYNVIHSLERFALYDDDRYLLIAATSLIILNTVRAIPLYMGWFLIGEGVSRLKLGRAASWLIPLIAIPSSYAIIARHSGYLALHFGPPALFGLLSILVMLFSTRDIRGWLSRSLVLSMLVFSFQWLDVAPSLTRWGFGGGELSMAVKNLSVIAEWDWVMDALSIGVFATAFAGGIVAVVLLVGINMLNVQYRKLRERDRKIAELREEGIRARGYSEIQQLVHDLRRPLTTVLGLADVMVETLPHGSELEHANRIVETGAHMNHMIEELLKEDARQDVTIGALVEYIKSQVSAFEWRRIVEVNIADDVSGRLVCVNMIRFSRALVNLLDNARLAVRAKPLPRIFFSVKAEAGEAFFIVADNGRGFSDKFFARNGFSEWDSTGIGLAFVAGVAEKHGGRMTITNLPADGAEVTINLPLKEV